MLTTYSNARNFTQAGAAKPAELDKRVQATMTAIGALIPADVVAAATAVSGFLSTKSDANDGTATWTHLGTARVLLLVVGLIAIPAVFRVASGGWWTNGWRGLGLLLLTIASFGLWLALQPLSIYQGWFSLDASQIAAVSVVAVLLVGGLGAAVGGSQAATEPDPK